MNPGNRVSWREGNERDNRLGILLLAERIINDGVSRVTKKSEKEEKKKKK